MAVRAASDFEPLGKRRSPRRPWGGKMPLACSECEKVTIDLYWRDAKGKPLDEPLCSGCFEQQLRRLTRESEN